jgi:GDP-L-fucose synthase
VWGTGKPLREFIFSEDLGDACTFLMERFDDGGMINAGSSQEISIGDLAHIITDIVGYRGKLTFDHNKPDGTPRKIMDNSRLSGMGWHAITTMRQGLKRMYDDFCRRETATTR